MSSTTLYASSSTLAATTSSSSRSAITPPDRRRRRSSCSPPPAPRAPSHRREASMQQRRHVRVPSLIDASPATRTLSAFTALCFANEPSLPMTTEESGTEGGTTTPLTTFAPSFQTPDLCSPTSSISNSSTAGTPEGGMRQLTLASTSNQDGEEKPKLAASPILGGSGTPQLGGWTSPLMQSALHRRQHSVPLDPMMLMSAGPLGGLGIDEAIEEEEEVMSSSSSSSVVGGMEGCTNTRKKEEPFWSLRRLVVVDTTS